VRYTPGELDQAIVEGVRMDIGTRARLADKLFSGDATPEDYNAIDRALSRLKRQGKIGWSPVRHMWSVVVMPSR
jgi:hypothetical protein